MAKYQYPINFSELHRYAKDWDTDKIILFTKIIHLCSKQGKLITMGKAGLRAEFRWTRRRTDSTVDFFISQGFIEQLPTGVKQLTKYKVLSANIVESAEKIFNVPSELNPLEKKILIKETRKELASKMAQSYKHKKLLEKHGANPYKLEGRFVFDLENDVISDH